MEGTPPAGPEKGPAGQLVEKARLRRSFPTERVSPALSARPGKRAGKPCCARLRPLKNPWFWKEPRFLRPSDARNAHEKCCGIRLWGAERKRVPCGHLGPKGPKRPGGGERNERRARPAPTATIERPGVCPKPRQARREASALWAVARSAKRPAGVSKYKGCARPARRTPIFARERNERRARPAPAAKIEVADLRPSKPPG